MQFFNSTEDEDIFADELNITGDVNEWVKQFIKDSMTGIGSGEITWENIQYNWSTGGCRYTYLGIEAIISVTGESPNLEYGFYLDGHPFRSVPNKVLENLWHLCYSNRGLHYPFTGAIAKLRRLYGKER